MDAQTGDTISAGIRAAGFNHTRVVTPNGDTITLDQRVYSGADILALLSILVPNGAPLGGITVTLSSPIVIG